MSKHPTLEILSDGRLRFTRGNAEFNKNMIEILSEIIDDEEVMSQLHSFFQGSEEVELLVGDSILCG
jgi:hypothetical protein